MPSQYYICEGASQIVSRIRIKCNVTVIQSTDLGDDGFELFQFLENNVAPPPPGEDRSRDVAPQRSVAFCAQRRDVDATRHSLRLSHAALAPRNLRELTRDDLRAMESTFI